MVTAQISTVTGRHTIHGANRQRKKSSVAMARDRTRKPRTRSRRRGRRNRNTAARTPAQTPSAVPGPRSTSAAVSTASMNAGETANECSREAEDDVRHARRRMPVRQHQKDEQRRGDEEELPRGWPVAVPRQMLSSEPRATGMATATITQPTPRCRGSGEAVIDSGRRGSAANSRGCASSAPATGSRRTALAAPLLHLLVAIRLRDGLPIATSRRQREQHGDHRRRGECAERQRMHHQRVGAANAAMCTRLRRPAEDHQRSGHRHKRESRRVRVSEQQSIAYSTAGRNTAVGRLRSAARRWRTVRSRADRRQHARHDAVSASAAVEKGEGERDRISSPPHVMAYFSGAAAPASAAARALRLPLPRSV